jgi:hypothetical protein
MAHTDYPDFGTSVIEGVRYDRDGIGSVASRTETDGAFWVSMRPQVFLSLSTPLPVPRASISWLSERIADGEAISPPMLFVRPERSGMPAVMRHDGRHRATALLARSVERIPVRISVSGLSWEEIDESVISAARRRMRAQRSTSIIAGPLFEDAEVDLSGMPKTGIPPPSFLATDPKTAIACGVDETSCNMSTNW